MSARKRYLVPQPRRLKVPRPSDDTVHRVYCRHSDTPRIGMRDGVLYWLVDERVYAAVGRQASAPSTEEEKA